MSKIAKKREILKQKLFTKNRLIIVNEDTFEEIFTFRLTLMNVFVAVSLGAILIITFTIFFISFTPLKEFIPGYASGSSKKETTELALKADSLSKLIRSNEAYLKSIQNVLNGKVETAKLSNDSIKKQSNLDIDSSKLNPSKEELDLRKEK